ncbi:MAG TPA: glycoside hydrolase family 3 N-terminal domain-containing protein, partial [Longimicrobiaceae bacterium]|nr:glycoside hydrolase family 3 N-terminal domain-containing protein [Longimicrobiaceae bacterium]
MAARRFSSPFSLALALALAACARERPETPWNEARLRSLTTAQKAAQLVTARAAPAPGDTALADSAVARLAALARSGLGGVWRAGGSAAAARMLVDTLQASAALPLLVAAELGRGAGGAFAGATELPAAARVGGDDAEGVARALAGTAAREARTLGIHLGMVRAPALAPAGGELPLELRNPRAAAALAAFLEGLRGAGVLAGVAALEPAASGDTALPVPRWDRASLEATQLTPLRRAMHEGVDAISLGTLALPALTDDSLPLPLSPQAVLGLVRRDLAHDGLVVADLDPGGLLARRYGETGAAVAAVAAGADLLLGAADPA